MRVEGMTARLATSSEVAMPLIVAAKFLADFVRHFAHFMRRRSDGLVGCIVHLSLGIVFGWPNGSSPQCL